MQPVVLATNDNTPLATSEECLLAILPWLTLQTLKEALQNNTGYPFALYGWKRATAPTYGVVSLDGGVQSVWADGHMVAQTISGTIDIFTKDPTINPQLAVQRVMNMADASWYLNSVQYEEDTGYIHFEWVWEVV